MGDAALADELFGSPSAAILLQGLPVRNAAHFSVCKIVGSHRFQVRAASAVEEKQTDCDPQRPSTHNWPALR